MQPRPWTQPLAPGLAPPDVFLHLRLQLTDAWLASDGEWHAIRDETSPALWSILGYLRWHGPHLLRRDPAARPVADVDEYLASRPLVAAIDTELAGRGEIAAGDALAHLRAIGVAPWELPVVRSRRRARRA